MAFELGTVLPGHTLRPASGIADERVVHLVVADDGSTFGLVRSFADPTLLYAVSVIDGVPHEPTAIAGHHWFRDLDGIVRPAPEPPRSEPRPSLIRRLLERLRIAGPARRD